VVLITVPTFKILWGFQDIVAQHKRRYRKRELEQLLSNAGIESSSDLIISIIFCFFRFSSPADTTPLAAQHTQARMKSIHRL